MKKKVGLIVNPIAGMGGKVGLKGTDGAEILERAILIGATPESPGRAIRALRGLAGLEEDFHFLTYPGEMGESELVPSGFEHTVIGTIRSGNTAAEDTERAADEMRAAGVDLLLFVGGDGTARNIYNAVGDQVPVLGIPAGVKMHSAVFGTTPRNAAELVRLFLKGKTVGTREAEVMDIDEDAFREQRVSARLYGYLRVPFERRLVQSVKAGRTAEEDTAIRAIALDVISNMEPDCVYIIGPGTTTREIMRVLDLENTLLGVDIVSNKSLVAKDVNEGRILELIDARPARIVVTIIGGQGYLFGRGNQQISDRVIERVGRDNLIVISTRAKLFALNGEPMMVDTGSETVNQMLSGYVNVVTGVKEKVVYKVCS